MSGLAGTRETEVRAVSDFLARIGPGPAGLLVEGEPGIGKTTVWSEAVRLAAEFGFRVLSARASAAEAKLAFAVLADLLDDVDLTVLDQLPPVQRVALNRVLLRGDVGPATDERVTAAAFLSVLKLLTSQPGVLVAIDDTQWLDPPSRAVVSFVVRRLKGPVGIVAAARTGDPDCPGAAWLQLARDEMLVRLSLRPLSLGAVHAVIAARLGRTLPRPIITRVHQVSGGNPLYALELARTLDEHQPPSRLRFPDSLSALVRRRLGTISEETARMLLAAACAANLTVAELAEATHTSIDDTLRLIESAENHGIITLDGNRVRFTHPLLSYGVYTQASAPQRRAMHRNLAAVTELTELRARHLALAAVSADERTLRALDTAAGAAAARGAPSAAAELTDLAIGLGGDTPMRRLQAAEQHFRAGSLNEARSRVQSVIDALPPGTLRTVALMLRGAVDGYGDRLVQAGEVLTQAVAEAGDNPGLRLQALLLLALVVGLSGDLGASVDYARRAVADAEQIHDPAVRSQALALWVQVSFMYGLDTDEQALQTALALEDPNSTGPATLQASAVAAVNCAWTGKLDEARTKLAAVAQHCLNRGHEVDVVWAAEFATMVDLWLGRYADATRTADDAVQRAEQIGGQIPLIDALTCQAAVAAHCGREDDARRAASAAVATARSNDIAFKTAAPLASLAFLEVSLRNYEAALATLEPLLAAFDSVHGTEIMVGGYLPDAVEALVAVGRLDDAEPLLAALETNGARLDRPWMLAVGARGRALLLAARGDLDAAAAAAQQAMAHHDRLPMPFERARTQLLMGQLERRRRHRKAATQTLTEALDCFEAIGAPLWAGRARAELAPLQFPPAEALSLTPAEQRVAERAAAGLSNQDIAVELFLSPKTVEMNLSRVYRKLGIRSRAQLYARLNPTNTRENPDSLSPADG